MLVRIKYFRSERLAKGLTFCLSVLIIMSTAVFAQPEITRLIERKPGIEEKLGGAIDLNLTFFNEQGQEVALKELIDKPTVLTLVYYRCPGICTPVLNEVASVISRCDLMPGDDYQVLTISFDYREKDQPDLAYNKKNNMFNEVKKHNKENTKDWEMPAESWHFMTGSEENIMKLTESVGFYFKPDNQDYIHSGTLIFLTKEGKIVRYLDGLKVLAMEMKLAVAEATEGRIGTVMQKIQKLCFSYDREGKTYVFMVNRLILGVGILVIVIFGGFLILKGKPQSPPLRSGLGKNALNND